MSIPLFRYYKHPEVNAMMTQVECQSCGTDKFCLEGEYFDRGNSVVSVCLNCLARGKITVNIQDFLINRIKNHLAENCTDCQGSIIEQVKVCVDELSRTPPVPWIQYNDWPVCCNDFCMYLGEWSQKEIVERSKDVDPEAYLMSILNPFCKEQIDDFNSFWDDIGNGTAIFAFKCVECSKIIAVSQSY